MAGLTRNEALAELARRGVAIPTNPQAIKPSEDQGKSQTYAKLMATGEQQYEQAVKDGYNPSGPINSFARGIEDSKWIGGLAPILRDDKADRGRAAERLFQDAQLKAMTGAGQSGQEL